MKNIFYITIITLILCSCKSEQPNMLTGQLSGALADYEQIYLLQIKTPRDIYNGSNYLVVDSAAIDDEGRFTFPDFHLLDTSFIYRLNLSNGAANRGAIIRDYTNNNYLFVVNEGADISLSASGTSLTANTSIKTTGKNTSQLAKLLNIEQPLYQMTHDFKAQVTSAPDLIDEHQKAYFSNMMSFVQDSITPYYDKVLAQTDDERIVAYVLSQLTEIKKIEDNYSFYKQYALVDSSHPYTKWWTNKLEKIQQSIRIGAPSKNIVASTLAGDTLALHSIEGKLILLDFWASWCSPCREENKNTVAPLFAQYQSQGFNVYSVSFDKKREDWERASIADQISWHNVADLQGKKSAIWSSYAIESLPTTFLLDHNYNVLAKNIRGEELKEYVKNYLKHRE